MYRLLAVEPIFGMPSLILETAFVWPCVCVSPVMVDEEDEKVLTTEELRVEVSRFLKGVSHS